MLSGLLNPTSGEAHVLGFVPWERKNEMKRQFSLLMGQKNALWWDLPAQESLELNRAIYGIDRERFRKVVGKLSELLDVADKMNVMVRELSLGERMKMELISALIHEPKVLFLDEPTIGLDVVSQKRVREFLPSYVIASSSSIAARYFSMVRSTILWIGSPATNSLASLSPMELSATFPISEKSCPKLPRPCS